MESGALLTLDLEKATAGGRMLARHEGRVILVSGGIPGERVIARVERVAKGMAFAATLEVAAASSDRRTAPADWRCGGNVLAHVRYSRQLQLKAEIIGDAFIRIARLPLAAPPAVAGSPETGYRLRARLHVHDGRIGFFREGSHELCDAAGTGQLAAGTCAWIAEADQILGRARLIGLTGIEIAENVGGDARACHLEARAGTDLSACAALAQGLVGLSAERADRAGVRRLAGDPVITEALQARAGDPASAFRLRRDVRAFFQGNRFLLERLVTHVATLVPAGPVVDLFAGVGLFGLALAAAGVETVTLVEGDPVSGADLEVNAVPFGARVRVVRQSVEAFVGSRRAQGGGDGASYVVDPPRTGLSKDAMGGLLAARPHRIVYVSCDVATLARDARRLVDAGYELERIDGFDLFPNTAHVETVAVFVR